jgi:hypothetical protein
MKVLIKVWRASPLAMLMTVLAVLAEAVSNGLRAYGLGEHLSHFTVSTPWGFKVSLAGVVLVAGAAAISVYQAKFATILLTGKVTAQRWISAPFLVMCLLISGASKVSHVRDAQRAKGSGETTTRGDYDRVERGYLLLFGELNELQKQNIRTVDVINADIRALDIPMKFWRRSKQCMDITEEDTKKACAQALALYQERGNAARKAELEGEVKEARQKLEKTERPGELSWLDEFVAFLWPWLFGTGIVLVATFGYAISMMQAKLEPAVSPSVPLELAVEPDNDDDPPGDRAEVVSWVREFQARNGRKPQIPEVQARFQLPKTTAWRRIKAA